MSESLAAAEDFTALLLKMYNPTVWADFMQITTEYTNYIAAVQSNCEIQKLLTVFTTSASTLIPQIISRAAGGMVSEIPKCYERFTNAKNNFD